MHATAIAKLSATVNGTEPRPRPIHDLRDIAQGCWNGACNPVGLLNSLAATCGKIQFPLTDEDATDLRLIIDHVRSLMHRFPEPPVTVESLLADLRAVMPAVRVPPGESEVREIRRILDGIEARIPHHSAMPEIRLTDRYV